MTINGLSEEVRTPRWAIIRLGYKKRGERGDFPRDSDVFCIKREAGCDPDIFEAILAAYGGQRIKDAAEEVYGLGKGLRFMLPWEFDAVANGREVSWELLNRAWGKSRIRCSGTGGGEEDGKVGEAWVRDPAYADVLRRRHLLGEERKGGWTATCLGPDCPLWHSQRTKENTLPGCHREGRFSAELLHPETNPEAPNYIRQLGWVQVSTGSFNGAVDVQSGLRMLRARAGRSHNVPFTLARIARPISTPEGRVVKATLAVKYDLAEALTFTYDPSGTARAILPPAKRRELLALATQEVQFAHVSDIQPQPVDRPAVAAVQRALPPSTPQAPFTDRDDAVDAARLDEAEAEADRSDDATWSEPEEEVVRKLSQDDVDELKVACGGVPGKPDTLGRYRELVEASYHALGTKATGEWAPYVPLPNAPIGQATYLTTRHRAWIEQQLRAPAASDSEVADPNEKGRS